MLRLNLFGTVDLIDQVGRSKNGELGGNKPLAVLLYLVVEGNERPLRRDVVAGLLWPESEQKHARQSLNQSLHQLRNALGDVVSSRGQEELSVDPGQITVDCFEFRELAATGRLEESVALYRGDFAYGLYVKGSADFDDWLSRQRAAWRSSLGTVLLKLFNAAVDTNDLPRAASWAEKLLEVAPENDEPVQTLVPLLVERGQAPTAIRLFEKYERTLSELFDLEPPAKLAALISNLSQGPRPPRFPKRHALHVGDPVAWRRRRLTPIVAATVVLAGTILLGAQILRVPASNATVYEASPPKVAVVPFAYGGSAQRAAAVLNEALQWRLRDVGFQVLSGGSQDTSAIRKLVGVNGNAGMIFVVGGDVETQSDASLVARIWLKDAASGKRLWESRFTQKEPDAHLIATQLSDAVATQVRRAAGNVAALASGSANVSAESWKDVYGAQERMAASADMRRQGSVAGSATELKDAEISLIQVSQREPDWALPWILRAYIAEARALSSLIAGDPRQGAAELDRGIRLLDSVAARLPSEDIYETRGELLFKRWVFGVDEEAAATRLLGRAESDLRKALGLVQERSGSYAALSGVMFAQGKYAESFVYARRAYDSNVFLRSNEEILNRLFNSALHAGDVASADHWCKQLQQAEPGKWPAVMCRIHIAGFAPQVIDVKTLEQEIADVVAAPPIRQVMEPRLKAAYAITLAQLGQTDSARATLAALAGNQDPEVVLFSAFAHAALKDAPQAHALLRKYLSEYRGTRSAALRMRWLN